MEQMIRSSAPVQAAVQAVMASLRHQTHARALIVGLSLGGYVAMASAHDRPQEIAGLVLSGCCLDYRGAPGILSWLDSSLVTTLFSEDRLNRMQAKALRSQFPAALIELDTFTHQVRTFAKRLSAAPSR